MRFIQIATAVLVLALTVNVATAEERGTRQEAEALVKKAVEFIKTEGAEKAYAEFGKRPGPFVDRDLYVMVYDLTGKCMAHGQSPSMVGKDMSNMKDPSGKAFIQERLALAKEKGSFWQDYQFKDPVSQKILPKEAYCEKLEQSVVCSGVYKVQ